MELSILKPKNIAGLGLIGVSFFGAMSVLAVDESRLWVPGKYETLFLDLKKAAEKANALEKCKTVLRGTVDLEQSKDNHPIFRILCRQSNNKTYNEMVDGVSFETLTTKVEAPIELSVEEALVARKTMLWKTCSAAVDEKIRLMQGVTRTRDEYIAPEHYSQDDVVYLVDFNAKDMYGADLKYRAKCVFGVDDWLTVTIFGRKPS